MVLITQNFDPHKIGWIKCSFLKFSQPRDVVHRIRAPYLFHFETRQIFDYSNFSASTVHNSLKIMFQNFTF